MHSRPKRDLWPVGPAGHANCPRSQWLEERLNNAIDSIHRIVAIHYDQTSRPKTAEEQLAIRDPLDNTRPIPEEHRWMLRLYPQIEWLIALNDTNRNWYSHPDRRQALERHYPDVAGFAWHALLDTKATT